MTNSVVLQRRTTRIGTTGGAVYAVETYLDDRGELPDQGAFLHEIVDPSDATKDVLVRVSSVADLAAYSMNRAQTVRTGGRYYRSAITVLEYTDLNVAKTAVAVMEDFINRLVVAVVSFNTEFTTANEVGPPLEYATLTFPLIGDAIEASLVADVAASAAAVTDAKVSAEKNTAKCAAHSALISQVTDELGDLRTTRTTLSDIDVAIAASVEGLSAALSAGETFAAAVDVGVEAYMADVVDLDITDSEDSYAHFHDLTRIPGGSTSQGTVPLLLDPYTDSLNAGRAAVSALNTKVRRLTAARGAIDGQISLKEAQLIAEESSAEGCAAAQRIYEAEVVRAESAQKAAEDALLEVCPTYDLTTIEGL